MALPKTDAFTAANGTRLATHDAGWVEGPGQWSINNNSVYCSARGAANGSMARWATDAPSGTAHYAKATLASSSGNTIGVGVHIQVGGSGYYFFADPAAAGSYVGSMSSSGTPSDIGGDRGGFSVSDIIEARATSGGLTIHKNGSLLATITDATYSNGTFGLSAYNDGTGAALDDFEGGNVGGGNVGNPKVGIVVRMPLRIARRMTRRLGVALQQMRETCRCGRYGRQVSIQG